MDRDGELDKQLKKYEVKHVGHFDIVVNRTIPEQSEVDELLLNITNNLAHNPNAPLNGWCPINFDGKTLYRDRQIKPRYFAKMKWLGRDKYMAYKKGERELEEIHENQRYNSLLNEFSIAEKVRKIVGSDTFQEVAKQNGFDTINFIEPLAGYIDKNSGDKMVIYRHVEGETGLTRPNGSNDFDFSRRMMGDLKRVFIKNGVDPTDLRQVQFMIQRGKNEVRLLLMDIEAYRDTER